VGLLIIFHICRKVTEQSTGDSFSDMCIKIAIETETSLHSSRTPLQSPPRLHITFSKCLFRVFVHLEKDGKAKGLSQERASNDSEPQVKFTSHGTFPGRQLEEQLR
jgi:hypothetical protein